MLYTVLQRLTRLVLRGYCGLRVTGLEHVPREGGVLLAANHQSFLDPPIVAAFLPRPAHFLAKAELFRVPLLGRLIRRLNAHPVDRAGGDAAALRLGAAILRRGQVLLVFPEGTRGRPGAPGAGRAGVGLLATLSAVPVVPAYVAGSGRALPRGGMWPRPARVSVTYGPPLRFGRARGRERYQAVTDEIMAAIGRLGAGVETGGNGPPTDAGGHTDRTARGITPAGQTH